MSLMSSGRTGSNRDVRDFADYLQICGSGAVQQGHRRTGGPAPAQPLCLATTDANWSSRCSDSSRGSVGR